MFRQKNCLSQFVFSLCLLSVYISGCIILANYCGLSWSDVPISLFLINAFPFWLKVVALFSVFCGVLLIYFIPGVFIVRNMFTNITDRIEFCAKGFLFNYFYYYSLSTIFKLASGHSFTREAMIALMIIAILINLALGLYRKRADILNYAPFEKNNSNDKLFMIIYFVLILCLIYICRNKIFYYGFFDENEGLRQLWAAFSVKQQILPTIYNERFTLLAGFPFAPSIYLNMFAITLFGENGLAIRIEILIAFTFLGVILRNLIYVMRNERKLKLHQYLPLFLYLIIYFIIIAYRAGYNPPTELAKSNETLFLTLFFTGFYLLFKKGNTDVLLPALFLFLATMIRYNGIFVVFILLFLLNRKKCLFTCCLLWIVSLFMLNIFLLVSAYNFSFFDLIFTQKEGFSTMLKFNKFLDLKFTFGYLKNYFLLTSGLSVFLFLSIKNEYSRAFLITTILYLLLPLFAMYVPAHFFVPILFFPLISYYIWE